VRYVQKYGAARTWNDRLHIVADNDQNIVKSHRYATSARFGQGESGGCLSRIRRIIDPRAMRR